MSADTPSSTLKLALGQMLVEGGAVAANLARATDMIRAAAAQGCQLIVLPECLDVGWTDPRARELAEPIPGPRSELFAQVAAAERIGVLAGLTERAGPQVYNAAVLLDDQGQLLLHHRKINELEIALDLYAIGDRLQVAHTRWGTLGVNICADNFPNALDIGRTLGRMGAQLIAAPCAWAVDAQFDPAQQRYGDLWREAFGQLARAFRMPVVGVSNVGPIGQGPWAGRRCIGCSLVVDAEGREQITGPSDQPALLVADVALWDQRPRGTAISGML
ncbi:MAG: carbon-nitrogen hydrolase family protein [Pirellulaceae bacterium]|jgi:predicted amidohydrolase|nr:carbon-nitrogen hydrolase family protein [Pirellulaceae bacterium]